MPCAPRTPPSTSTPNPQVWLRAIEHALTTGGDASGDAARKLLERALATLPRRKHVKAISHAALLEFRVGAPERGRSIMEGVLRNYPRRLDLWSMYIDQVGRGARAEGGLTGVGQPVGLSIRPKHSVLGWAGLSWGREAPFMPRPL